MQWHNLVGQLLNHEMQVMSPDDQMLNQFVNIARGTTDPGYWAYNLNYPFDYIEFVFILAGEVTQV